MKNVTFNGPQSALRIRDSGRVLRRGQRTEVTNAEADHLASAGVDVTVHEAGSKPKARKPKARKPKARKPKAQQD